MNVDYLVFRRPHRRSPFSDVIDWSDYRSDRPRHRGPVASPWARPRRHRLFRVLAVLAIIWIVVRMMRGRRYSGWF